MPKKILLVGNYHANNFGDDLLLLASKKGLKKAFPDSEIKVMSPGESDFPLPPAGIRSYLKLNRFKSSKGVKWCDFVVFGGGGLFNSEVPYSIYIWGKVINAASKFNKPVYMIGQSFSVTESSQLDRLMSKVKFVTVRDSISYNHLERKKYGFPLRLTNDLVFSLAKEQIPAPNSKFDDDFVVVNLRKYDKVDPAITREALSMIVDYFSSQTPLSVYLLPFGDGDESYLEMLAEDYKDNGRVMVLPMNQDDCMAAIANAQAVISSRLHPMLVGLIFEKPILSLSYSSKSEGILKDMDLSEWDVSLRSENFEKLADLLVALNSLIAAGKPQAKKDRLVDKADSNFKYLKLFVEG